MLESNFLFKNRFFSTFGRIYRWSNWRFDKTCWTHSWALEIDFKWRLNFILPGGRTERCNFSCLSKQTRHGRLYERRRSTSSPRFGSAKKQNFPSNFCTSFRILASVNLIWSSEFFSRYSKRRPQKVKVWIKQWIGFQMHYKHANSI